MADRGEEDEYESDPEQAKLSLKMRRRTEASDDEDEDHGAGNGRFRGRVFDYESDDHGEYDDEVEELVEEFEGGIEGTSERDNDRANGDGRQSVDQFDDNADGGVENKNDPFAVPTAGSFYMHDDRFGDHSGGKNRRTLGGKKLWELRDDSKWGHDKFEEMTGQDRRYDERRRGPRGRNRARGRNQGEGRGLLKNYKVDNNNNNNNNQMSGSKSVRGRGPRRYQPSTQNTFETTSQSKEPAKKMAKASHASSGRASAATSASHYARKNVVASNLNYASPPFYPSTQETNLTERKDAQSGPLNRGPRPLVMGENYPISESNIPQGRNVSVLLDMDKLYIDDSISKPVNNLQTQVEGRGPVSFGQVAHQPVSPYNVNRLNLQTSGLQFSNRIQSASGSRVSSPPKAHGLESADLESSAESKTALVGKGKGGIPRSFSYGDQNLCGAPSFLPVMQFSGQHPRGFGVPAVGMAFPGYVGQPNGMGNSEMTWLPVLAGTAGGLGGAAYPYITMDASYNARPSGLPSSLAPINKDGIMNKSSSEVEPSQKLEIEKDEWRQQQNKARRYTEMKFDK